MASTALPHRYISTLDSSKRALTLAIIVLFILSGNLLDSGMCSGLSYNIIPFFRRYFRRFLYLVPLLYWNIRILYPLRLFSVVALNSKNTCNTSVLLANSLTSSNRDFLSRKVIKYLLLLYIGYLNRPHILLDIFSR